jgi:hypothetical protein
MYAVAEGPGLETTMRCKRTCRIVLQEDQDWGIVAMVLDRLFLWMFGAAAVVGKILVILILKCRIKFIFNCKLT